MGLKQLKRYGWELSEAHGDLFPRRFDLGLDLWQLDRARFLGGCASASRFASRMAFYRGAPAVFCRCLAIFTE